MRQIPTAFFQSSFRRLRQRRIRRIAVGWLTVTLLATAFIPLAARPSPAANDDGLVVSAPTPKPINYDALTQEATALLQQEIRIDTTNPPGDELPVAKLLKQ